jgi:polyisoprenoid-binding protein YceI
MSRRIVIFAGAGFALVAAAVIAVIAIWLLRSDDPNLLTAAPTIPAASNPTTAAATATPAATGVTPVAVNLPAGVRRFVVVPAESYAKFVVEETLRGLPATAVGQTSDISGEIFLSRDGLFTAQASAFKVDLRTLKTDESMRDNYIKQNTLNTSQFPFAEFKVESVTGFPASYTENSEVRLTLAGTMTIHGVSKPITFSVLARQSGNTLTAAAQANFKMTDFGMSPPSVFVASAKDEVLVEVVLIAREAGA